MENTTKKALMRKTQTKNETDNKKWNRKREGNNMETK